MIVDVCVNYRSEFVQTDAKWLQNAPAPFGVICGPILERTLCVGAPHEWTPLLDSNAHPLLRWPRGG
jgi:hypothetical protein